MALNKQKTRDLYRKRAKGYDLFVWLFRLVGFRMDHYRQETVKALNLNSGDTVFELGCGTGLNFSYLEQSVGFEGKIIGVDLTDSMLDVAKKRIERLGWVNVDLIQTDVSDWRIPDGIAGVFSTFAITLVPEYDDVIRKASLALKPGGRLAVLDLKEPKNWPDWLVKLAIYLNKPFGVSVELADRHPWESIRNYLSEVETKEYYFGAIYLSVGEKPYSQINYE